MDMVAAFGGSASKLKGGNFMKRIMLYALMVLLINIVAVVTGCSNCGNGGTPGACEDGPVPAK